MKTYRHTPDPYNDPRHRFWARWVPILTIVVPVLVILALAFVAGMRT